jgi:WD40 repeat protein
LYVRKNWLGPIEAPMHFSTSSDACWKPPHRPLSCPCSQKHVSGMVHPGRLTCGVNDLQHPAYHLDFSRDGRALAWAGVDDSTIHLVETATGRERRQFAGQRGHNISLRFSAGGRVLASSASDGTVVIWDLTGRLAGPPEYKRRSPVQPIYPDGCAPLTASSQGL